MIYPYIFKNILYPLDRWRSGDYAEVRYLREFERTQYLPEAELQALVMRRLVRILDRAYQNIPYYKKSFEQAGIVPSDIKTPNDMLAVPILEKRQVQEHLPELVDPNWPKMDLLLDKTGGSTGTPVNYYYSRDRRCSRAAATTRHNRWCGHEIGMPRANLWGAARDLPPPTIKQRLRDLIFPKAITLNSVNMTPETMIEFNEQLKRHRPRVLLAYANAVALFAKFLKSRNITAYQPKGIISTAEVLRDEDRQLVEEVFGAPVFNRLGCREVSIIASECNYHDGLHTMAEGLFVEIVRGNRHTEPGERGEILITDMLNDPMPLIRYRLSDTATWKSGTCSCGRTLPRLTDIQGRVTEFLVGMDDRFCSGAALAALIVSHKPTMGQVQIVQDERNKVLYRLGCGKNTILSQEDRDFIKEKTELYLGNGMGIEYEYVDSIPHEASGKYMFSKSKVAREMFDQM